MSNYGDGSGYYVSISLDLLIENDGKGNALVIGPSGTIDVAADPLPPVPKLGKFPPLGALEPQEFSGVLITLDAALLFDFDKYNIRPDAQKVIATVARALKDNDVPIATVEGHTDAIGTDAYNQTLSENRAKAVLDALKADGVSTQLEAVGYGKTKPVAPNTTPDNKDNPAGRQLNRRVEIFIPIF
jgi:OOP family OmpA-OmpF porin